MRTRGSVVVGAALLLVLTGCGSAATQPTYTATVTVAPTPSEAPPASAAPILTTPATPVDTPTAIASAPADSGAPAGQCDDADLGVMIVPADGGGGAGSEFFDLLLTNTGGSTCVLRGTPGVSVVRSEGGAQIGPAADRVQTGVQRIVLRSGESASSPLRIVNIGADGGPLVDCAVVKGAGYRVYPPHSRTAFFVEDPDASACRNGPVFMTASPVIRFTS